MGGASLPVDASIARKRPRSNTKQDADNDRASKRSRREDKGKGKGKENGEKRSKKGPPDEPRRSGRDRNSGDSNNWWQATGSDPSEVTGSPAEPAAREAREAKEKADKPKRGRPRASNASTEEAPATKTTTKTTTKKSKSKKSGASTAAETSLTAASPQSRPTPRPKPQPKAVPRQSVEEGEDQEDNVNDEEEDEVGGDDEHQLPFRQLVPRTRLVPLATMTNKWAPLDHDAIAAVQSLLDECARPVLARLGSSSEKKERQDIARQAVAGVTRRQRSKLVKGIPVPTDGSKKKKTAKTTKTAKSTKPTNKPAQDFLAEPTAEMHALQSQLTPLQHAVTLLASERQREEAALADEYAQLRALETNAQAEQRTWRERQRRQHVLAGQEPSQHGYVYAAEGQGSRGHVGLGHDGLAQAQRVKDSDSGKEKDSGLFSDSFDGSVVDLASLGSHMDSVRGNLQQIDGVVAAMARSRAALQDVLGERLSGDQYERVLLGR